MKKHIKEVLEACERQGFLVKMSRHQHARVFTADGVFVTGVPCTPSDHRGWANMMAQLKRHGFCPAS